MRPVVVILLLCFVGSRAAPPFVDSFRKYLPSVLADQLQTTTIHQKIHKATSALKDIQGKLGGAGQKFMGALDKVKGVLATVDKFLETASGYQHQDVLPETILDSVPEEQPPRVSNAFAKRDASLAQVSFPMRQLPVRDGTGWRQKWNPMRRIGPEVSHYLPGLDSAFESQRGMSEAQIPYVQRAYRRLSYAPMDSFANAYRKLPSYRNFYL